MVAPGILGLLEPVRARDGLVVELGCGSGLLTKHLVDAGHRVLATDASPPMLELAGTYVPTASFERLCLPDDPIPDADAIVSVGHPVSYLDTEEQLTRAIVNMAQAVRPDGVVLFDICDIAWGEARRDQAPGVWFGDDWLLVTRFSVPDRYTFRREITTFVRSDDAWRRDDETHDNVLVDTTQIPSLLARHGVDAETAERFGDETLPAGLVAVIGHKTAP
jgi:SAM-dependent methyltransferase